TGNEKDVILCVVLRTQITQVKEIANSFDHAAFVLVADVREVMGEGFTPEQ
ncbi:MAG: YitT family protein, partial [Clostridiales bacterium]|nr:YitT family protein [Clostridiales bacterium]